VAGGREVVCGPAEDGLADWRGVCQLGGCACVCVERGVKEGIACRPDGVLVGGGFEGAGVVLCVGSSAEGVSGRQGVVGRGRRC